MSFCTLFFTFDFYQTEDFVFRHGILDDSNTTSYRFITKALAVPLPFTNRGKMFFQKNELYTMRIFILHNKGVC